MIGRHGMLLGESNDSYLTLEFAAPERILNNTETDIRSDIYSIGATLYYLLTGTTVRKSLHPNMPLEIFARQPQPPLRALAPETSNACESLINRLLATDPDKRCQNYEEILEALSEITGASAPPFSEVIARTPDQLAKIFKNTALFCYRNFEHLSKAGGIVAFSFFLTTALSWGLFGYILHLGSRIIIPANIILQAAISGPLILGLFMLVMNMFSKTEQEPKLSGLLKGFRRWPASTAIVFFCESATLLARTIFSGPFFFLYMLIDMIVKGTGCYALFLLATNQTTSGNLMKTTLKIMRKDYIGLTTAGLAFWTVEYLTAVCLHPLIYAVMLTLVLPFFSALMFHLNQGSISNLDN